MDALRIFDEKMRDGLIEDEPEDLAGADAPAEEVISVDDLGLSEIDQLSASLPQAFSAVAPFDPLALHRDKLKRLVPALPEKAREKIAGFLAKQTLSPDVERSKFQVMPQFVLATTDSFFGYALSTVTTYA
jgi:hypothetical protein